MSIPTCGPTGNVAKAIINIFAAQGFNPYAAAAARAYFNMETQPIKNEMSAESSKIGIVLVWFLTFIVILPLLIFIIWIYCEFNVNPYIILAIVVLILIIAIIVAVFATARTVTAIESTIEDALQDLSDFSEPQVETILFNTLNDAAAIYLKNIPP
jgi:uncharacterized membrane protein YbhN (UPF0104 family)